MGTDLTKLLAENPANGEFRPYCYRNKEADALTIYFRSEPDYSKRLTDHVTLYLSIESNEPVGCRIKGISGLIEDLPNFLTIDHDGRSISILFLPFWQSNPEVRAAILKLAEQARQSNLTIDDAELCPA